MSCSLCQGPQTAIGEALAWAQSKRHRHFLEDFHDADSLRQHLLAEGDPQWINSGGLDSVMRWWFSKKYGNLRERES